MTEIEKNTQTERESGRQSESERERDEDRQQDRLKTETPITKGSPMKGATSPPILAIMDDEPTAM